MNFWSLIAMEETEIYEPWVQAWVRVKLVELSELAQSQVVISREED